MIGITGTKGKTTTAFFTTAILREAGYKTGMVGTVCLDDGKQVTSSEHTTPESYDLQKMLFQMVENGCQCWCDGSVLTGDKNGPYGWHFF